MKFLSMIKIDESMPAGPPPPELYEAIAKMTDEDTANGTLLDTGGLLPSSDGAVVRVSGGKLTVVDGPFTEATEVVGGWAIHQVRTKAEAMEKARRFMQLHADLWPGADCTCEVRQIADAG